MKNIFENNIDELEKLFGKNIVSEKVDRLKYIFENTENSWNKNLEKFDNYNIKFILICEAPPFSETKIPPYFYNQTDRIFNKTIWKVFFGNEKAPTSDSEYYKKLAEKGFLLIDNLPFSMQYDSKHRKKSVYQNLLKNSIDWVLEKLNHNKIKISKDVKIAFGFKLNALQYIELTKGKLQLKNGQVLNFNETNIGANGAGFPDSKLLSKIFFQDFSKYKYYHGEKENPYCEKGENPLNFLNPKSLFWYYEEFYHQSLFCDYDDYEHFMKNLLNGKLSDIGREEKIVWKMYFENSKITA